MEKSKKKGFTLIELLAVIIILGILMTVAIVGINKAVENSRKRTLASTMDGYIQAVMTDLTQDYGNFAMGEINEDTVYWFPLSIVDLNKGGENPFGEWLDEYSAVLVTYSDENGYSYGFQFKDKSGHWMAPITQQDLTKASGLIKTGISEGLQDNKSFYNGDEVRNDKKVQNFKYNGKTYKHGVIVQKG